MQKKLMWFLIGVMAGFYLITIAHLSDRIEAIEKEMKRRIPVVRT